MSDFSSILNLPYVLPNQAQKHVTVNEWLERLDTLVQLSVLAADQSEAPGAPENGDRYIVPVGATGAFAGQDGHIAQFELTVWQFIPPQEGWRAWDRGSNTLLVFHAGAWQAHAVPQQLDFLGLNTSADATNRLSIASDATLFSHDGDNHRLTINKLASADTASVLYQSAFSGRAEIGLTGSEALQVRTSDDGTAWTTRAEFPVAEQGVVIPGVRSGRVTVALDQVAAIPTPSAGGFFLFFLSDATYPQASHAGIFVFDSGPSLQLHEIYKGSKVVNQGITDLTGTTGTTNFTNISVQGGEMRIENRQYSEAVTYDYLFIG
ncbi:MAG: hypothetical protein Hens3KO_24960 [Henriciella sp.]